MKTRNVTDPDAGTDIENVTEKGSPELEAFFNRSKEGRFTVGLPDVEPVKAQPKKPYWVGTLSNGPLHNWTAPGAGVRFVRAQGEMTVEGQYKGAPGQVVFLTDKQLEVTLKSVRNHVVRWMGTGEGRTGRIWPTDYYSYRASLGDEPLGRYLFLYELDPNAPQNRPVAAPEPMIKE